MIKKYSCEVDCANCANKIESEVKKLEGIKDCNISFMTLKCKIDQNSKGDIIMFLEVEAGHMDLAIWQFVLIILFVLIATAVATFPYLEFNYRKFGI